MPTGGFKITQPKGNYVGLVSNSSSSGSATTADIEVLDEGVSLTATVASVDFVGAGVTTTATGDAVTVTIPGAASAITVDEIDGSPSVAATEIKVPNGSLSVAATVATLAYVTPANGGLETITAHGNTGSTETFFAAGEGNVHTATLNANCTFTFAAVTSGKACSFTIILTQDGTGSRLVTWPGSVVWASGTAPVLSTAAAAVDVISFFTLDGGTIWYGFPTGGGASFATPAIVLGTAAAAGAATTVIRSDSTIVAFDATVPTTQAFGDAAATGSVAKAARRDHLHGMPSAATILALMGPQHVHVDNLTFSGDGATTDFELPASPVDSFSVAAYVAGVRTAITVSGAVLTNMNFAVAPVSGTDNIIVDIAAALV